MKYISFKINDKDNYINRSSSISDSQAKRIGHIVADIINGNYISYPFIYKLGDEFILIKEIDSIIYAIFSNTNPYIYLLSDIISINKEEITLKPNKPGISFVNTITEDMFNTLEMVIEAVIDNIANDKVIYLNPKEDIGIITLLFDLIPSRYLDYLTISANTDTKIRFSADYNRELYFSFKNSLNNSIIEPKRYSYTIVDNLKRSLKDAYMYKDRIDRLIEEKKIGIADICDLLNLIDGHIERINSLSKLSRAILNLDGMEYNASFIATLIFTNINKYKLDKSILYVYSFIYKNVLSSHSYIIKAFKDNIALFIDLSELEPKEALIAIKGVVPFPLIDYIYYLIDNNTLDSTIAASLNNISYSYLMLDLICSWIDAKRLTIVPNKYLSLYLRHYLSLDINSLDLIIERIRALNNKGLEALLNNEVIRIFRTKGMIDKLGIDRLLLILERLNIADSAHYIKKLNLVASRYSILDKLLELESTSPDYYNRLINELIKDSEGMKIVDLLNERGLIRNDNIEIAELDEYYNKYYLSRYHNDNGALINSIMSYLNKNNSLDYAIDIYNRYFSRLSIDYKNTLVSIRRINDFIFEFYDDIFKNPSKYIEVLDEINDRLAKGRIEANSYYIMLKIGEGIKNKNYKILEGVVAYKSFLGYKDELQVFYKYYFDSLIECYFMYVEDRVILDSNLINSFNLAIGPFLNITGSSNKLKKYLAHNEGLIFYFLLITANTNIKIYRRILDNVLKEEKGRSLKRYLNDYISYLRDGSIEDSVICDNTLALIGDYIENNMSFITKILLKLRHK